MIDLYGAWGVPLFSMFGITAGGAAATTGTVGLANIWNPIGWLLIGAAATVTIGAAIELLGNTQFPKAESKMSVIQDSKGFLMKKYGIYIIIQNHPKKVKEQRGN